MKLTFLGCTFASAEHLIFLPLVLAACAVLVWRLRRIRRSIALLASVERRGFLLRGVSYGRHVVRTVLFIVGLLFLFIALLRPQWTKKELVVEQQGRDLFIALDISRSMLVEDFKPNRLEFAKKKIRALLDRLECERVGLILFSGGTCVQCPLTTDYASFFMFLDQVDVETISSGTTAIDQAIQRTMTTFASMPTRKTKLLVLLTDGEDFSTNLAGIRAEAARQGLVIFTIGIGTAEGGPIPMVDATGKLTGHQKDQQGKVIISHLNEALVKELAAQTGGKYVRTTYDDEDANKIVRAVQKFEKERFDDTKISEFEDRYVYFLAVSFFCFLIEWLL
jgi:Ca-activated chloride channel homolog